MAKLPREIHRDEILKGMIEAEKALEAEAKAAADKYARSAGVGNQVGFQARLERIRQEVETRAESARSFSRSRLKDLAVEEVSEIAKMLGKMKIVEVELLQRVSMTERMISAASKELSVRKGTTGSQKKDVLKFPIEKETWFDEIANYRIDIKKDCQASVKQ